MSWAERLAKLLHGLPEPVRCSSPLVGVDSPKQAANALGVPWISNDAYDVRECVASVQRRLHGPQHVAHCGPSSGDIQNVPCV